MREFFRGWKRKTGIVTLGLACVVMSAWVRGAFYRDHFAVTLGDTRHHLIFRNGAVRWEPITL